MSEIKTNEKKLHDGTTITTHSQKISMANILEVEAGTNGYHGGDTGHGSRTYFRIEDLSSTDIRPRCYETEYGNKGIEVTLGGDCELDTIIEALEFIVNTLKQRIAGDADNQCDDDPRSDKYKAILECDAHKRMQEYCLKEYDIDSFPHFALFVDWCWRHNAGHWPDGTLIGDD